MKDNLVLFISMFIGLFIVLHTSPAHTYDYIAPTTFSISNSLDWSILEKKITKDDSPTIRILMNGLGGYTYMEEKFVEVVENAKDKGQKVIMVITTEADSAHALASCHASSVILLNNAALVFHGVEDVIGSTLARRKIYSNDSDDNAQFDYCVKAGWLDSLDVQIIIQLHKRIEVRNHNMKTIKEDWLGW